MDRTTHQHVPLTVVQQERGGEEYIGTGLRLRTCMYYVCAEYRAESRVKFDDPSRKAEPSVERRAEKPCRGLKKPRPRSLDDKHPLMLTS